MGWLRYSFSLILFFSVSVAFFLFVGLVLLYAFSLRLLTLLVGASDSDPLHFGLKVLHGLIWVASAQLIHQLVVLSSQLLRLLVQRGIDRDRLVHGGLVSEASFLEHAIHLHVLVIELYVRDLARARPIVLLGLLCKSKVAFGCRHHRLSFHYRHPRWHSADRRSLPR